MSKVMLNELSGQKRYKRQCKCMQTQIIAQLMQIKYFRYRETLEPIGCRNTDHKFHITTFHTPIICLHCSKFLKGLIHQGYRCKVCEISVHRGCISSTGRCKQGPVSVPPPVCDRQLSEFYWFVGPMDRDTASVRLENRKIGTYLLRVRPQGASNSTETMYALSLK